MSNRKLGALLAVPLITILVLSGCVQGNNADPNVPAPTPTSNVAPPEPVEPVTEDTPNGEELTQEQVEGLSTEQLREMGAMVYKLGDGTQVLVKKDEPLPAPVQAEVDAKATAQPQSDGTQDSNPSVRGTGEMLANEVSRATGKQVMVIKKLFVASAAEGDKQTMRWVIVTGATGQMYPIADGTPLSTVKAAAEAFIAAKPNPAEWMIVVASPH